MKIAVITGSRADRGPLDVVHAALIRAGHAVRWIDVEPSLPVIHRSEAVSIAAITATSVAGDLAAMPTDLVVLLGDRYEILGAAMGANMMAVPIAHLSGGDVTEGSADDCYRHAITKLAHLHFPTHAAAADRIIAMGEEPGRVHMVGCPGIDRILATDLLDREATFAAVGLVPAARLIVACLHPNTLGRDTETEASALARALVALGGDVAVVLIGQNADPGAFLIDHVFERLEADRNFEAYPPRTAYHRHLDSTVYLSVMAHADVMVGNSSAGLYEAPSFGTPTLNVGDRQRGRPMAASVITCEASAEAIKFWLKRMIDVGKPKGGIRNPFGNGHACERIVSVIGEIKEPKTLLRKRFYDIDDGHEWRGFTEIEL